MNCPNCGQEVTFTKDGDAGPCPACDAYLFYHEMSDAQVVAADTDFQTTLTTDCPVCGGDWTRQVGTDADVLQDELVAKLRYYIALLEEDFEEIGRGGFVTGHRKAVGLTDADIGPPGKGVVPMEGKR